MMELSDGGEASSSANSANAQIGKARLLEAFCCQEVTVPELLPIILKTYTKSAIMTQPRDLIHWSAAYFRAMSKGEVPPVKDRLEHPVKEAPNGLTKGFLRVLHKQLGKNKRVTFESLKAKWTDICLEPAEAKTLLETNDLQPEDFSWIHFVAAAAGTIENEGITDIMETVCRTMTEKVGLRVEPYIPFSDFIEAYIFLAARYGVIETEVEAASSFLLERANVNENMVGPKDFKDEACPPLQGIKLRS